MRQGLKITNRERKQVEKAIAKLDRRFASGRIEKRIYDFERGKLLANLNRPRFNETNLAKDAKAYWKRNEINHSPAPVGYWDHLQNRQRKASQNKINASLISFCDNGYWNSDDFQQAIKTASNNAVQQRNDLSYFEETVMASQKLGATMSAEQAWDEVSNSPQVVKALERLSNTIDSTMKMFLRQGVDEASAKAIIRAEAIRGGRAMTAAGYDANDAQQIVKAIMCGEMSTKQAASHVSSNIYETARAVANAMTTNNRPSRDSSTMNTATEPSRMWVNNYDIHAMAPASRGGRGAYVAANNFDIYDESGTNALPAPKRGGRGAYVAANNYNIHNPSPVGGPSLAQLLNQLAQLQNQFDLTNNPSERNNISFAIDSVQKEINRREAGMKEIGFETPESNVNSVNIPSQGGYDPRNNLKANQSLMQQTVKAMANGPSLSTVVKDIFTVQSNIYFDWTAGSAIEFLNNGTYRAANNSSNASAVYPSGEWTVFANVNSLDTLAMIGQSLEYATASPLWSPNDRAYLEYLKTVVASKMLELEAGVMNNAANTNAANNLSVNNANVSVNNANVSVNNAGNNGNVSVNNAGNNGGNNGYNLINHASNPSNFGPNFSPETMIVMHRGYSVISYEDAELGGGLSVKVVDATGAIMYRQSFDSITVAGGDPHDVAMYINYIDIMISNGQWANHGGA